MHLDPPAPIADVAAGASAARPIRLGAGAGGQEQEGSLAISSAWASTSLVRRRFPLLQLIRQSRNGFFQKPKSLVHTCLNFAQICPDIPGMRQDGFHNVRQQRSCHTRDSGTPQGVKGSGLTESMYSWQSRGIEHSRDTRRGNCDTSRIPNE